jgi:hypothetical protein
VPGAADCRRPFHYSTNLEKVNNNLASASTLSSFSRHKNSRLDISCN